MKNYLIVCFMVLIVSPSLASEKMDFDADAISAVDVRLAKQLWEAGEFEVILDVRTRDEYEGETGHVPNVLLMPVQSLPFRLDELNIYKNKTIGVICQSGGRSNLATQLLRVNGIKAVNIQGGTLAWSAAGYPIEKSNTSK